MTTFHVGATSGKWSGEITAVDELDRILDSLILEPGEIPYTVAVIIPDETRRFPLMLEIGFGHRERSYAFHVGPDDAAWAYEPGLPEVEGWVINYGGTATDIGPYQSRVTIAGAREAARQFVATGGLRPTNLAWDED